MRLVYIWPFYVHNVIYFVAEWTVSRTQPIRPADILVDSYCL